MLRRSGVQPRAAPCSAMRSAASSARRDRELVRRAIEEARTLFDGAGTFESGTLIRAERDALDARDTRRTRAP